jgi:hypothetical protein
MIADHHGDGVCYQSQSVFGLTLMILIRRPISFAAAVGGRCFFCIQHLLFLVLPVSSRVSATKRASQKHIVFIYKRGALPHSRNIWNESLYGDCENAFFPLWNKNVLSLTFFSCFFFDIE